MQVFEKHHSSAFDVALYVCDDLKGLTKLINRQIISDSPDCAETSLTMNIFHTSASYRVAGVLTLKEMIQNNTVSNSFRKK